MHQSVLDFFKSDLKYEEIYNYDVVELGSYDVNGSIRGIVQAHKPRSYTGVDLVAGPGVDMVADVSNMDNFRANSFDVVISTEMLEHVFDWRATINTMKYMLRPNGLMIITTRSKGFPYHAYPIDLWRYEIEDMAEIFRDMNIKLLRKDHPMAGVFVKVVKPHNNYRMRDLSRIDLYKMPQPK